MTTDRSKKTKALADASKDLVQLAHKFSPKKHVISPDNKRQQSILGWEIYEKIDGIRAIIKDGKLTSRYGNVFDAPSEFLAALSKTYTTLFEGLDGELVSSKGFQHTTSIVRDKTNKNTIEFWEDITYVVFDHQKILTKFCSRLAQLNKAPKCKYSYVLNPLCTIGKMADLDKQIKKAEKQGKEGLILRNPDSLYQLGRSWDLLKMKIFDDTEAIVIGYYPGEGKYTGVIGGMICELGNGTTFECGTGLSDLERSNPPKIGSKITVRFMGLTDLGKPRHPSYIGVRDYE